DGVADRRERIAQLVGERGEELVLAPLGLAQRVFHQLAVVDVRDHPHQPVRRAVLVAGGLYHRVDPALAGAKARAALVLDALAAQHALGARAQVAPIVLADHLPDRPADDLAGRFSDPRRE